MKTTSGTVHCIANCRTCKWEATEYRTARALALRHARKFRHIVSVDVGLAVTYDGRTQTKGEKV